MHFLYFMGGTSEALIIFSTQSVAVTGLWFVLWAQIKFTISKNQKLIQFPFNALELE